MERQLRTLIGLLVAASVALLGCGPRNPEAAGEPMTPEQEAAMKGPPILPQDAAAPTGPALGK
ncbi:MAG: hypothetical protein SNJ76_03760 [Fimbriimonadaceae bacterium]